VMHRFAMTAGSCRLDVVTPSTLDHHRLAICASIHQRHKTSAVIGPFATR
jgi:hypothetical protein